MFFETLESRRMFSVSLANGLLTVNGTGAADTISIHKNTSGQLVVVEPGGTHTFAANTVAKVAVNAGAGNDSITSDDSVTIPMTLHGGAGADSITGGGGDDVIFGDDGDDSLVGGLGNDELHGGNDNDTLIGDDLNKDPGNSAGADKIFGGPGIDMVDYSGYSANVNVSLDGVANDGRFVHHLVQITEGDNVATDVEQVAGGAGNDSIDGDAADNLIFGNAGNDSINGEGGSDAIHGGDGNDILRGGDGADFMFGDAGFDVLLCGAGNDYGDGGTEGDFIDGGDGNDSMNGAAGDDILNGDAGDDLISGGDGADQINGGDGNDRCRGDDGNDIIFGDAGDDQLYGEGGFDQIFGGDGNDGLFGGSDNDVLYGGNGSDRFLQTKDVNGTNHELIKDFASTSDVICLFRDAPETDGITLAGQNGSFNFKPGHWSNDEIEALDGALGELQFLTNNTKLLKTAKGESMTFWRVGDQANQNGATFGVGAWNDGGTSIFITNGGLNGGNAFSRQLITHELGHNWDEEYDQGGWAAESSWTYSNQSPSAGNYIQGADTSGKWWYRKSAKFVSSYSMTDPDEDFAESFAAYVSSRAGWQFDTNGSTGTPITAIPDKYNFMNNMINHLSTPRLPIKFPFGTTPIATRLV